MVPEPDFNTGTESIKLKPPRMVVGIRNKLSCFEFHVEPPGIEPGSFILKNKSLYNHCVRIPLPEGERSRLPSTAIKLVLS